MGYLRRQKCTYLWSEGHSSWLVNQKVVALSILFYVGFGNVVVQRRRQHVVSVAKERREAMFRTKRLCTEGFTNDMDVAINGDMMIEEESSIPQLFQQSSMSFAAATTPLQVVRSEILNVSRLRRRMKYAADV
ncbi:hypothetical protein L1887_05596 [Cichorium endivia]|nr:hypothetical protein L1887_05596 [Cichorium endivia]